MREQEKKPFVNYTNFGSPVFHKRPEAAASAFSAALLLLLLLLRRFSHVRLCATPQTAAHQASPSLGSPGKNTGVGCHFLLQCIKVKSEGEVAQSCPTLSDPMDCSLPGSSIHGIFQARVLEWGAIAFSVSAAQGITKPDHLIEMASQERGGKRE